MGLAGPLKGPNVTTTNDDEQATDELLEDFVALEAAPKSWFPQVPPGHPFLCVTGDSTLSVHRVAIAPEAS
jgi:hypothetical protein